MLNDDGYRYSLCIVYTGNNGQNISYRIADYFPEDGHFDEAYYTDRYDDSDEFHPTIIGANPEELELGKACVRKWKPQEHDDRRQWSYSYNAVDVYEILLDRNILDAADEEECIEILSSGIDIPWYINNNFLLPISQNDRDYEMILCSKKDFVLKGAKYGINSSVSDMLHTTHQFNKYRVRKRDLINNSLLRRTINNTDLISEKRTFYAFDKLPTTSGVFVPRSADAYITAFLKWYCRREKARLDITKKDVDKLLELLDLASDSETELESYLKTAPFEREEIAEALAKREVLVEDFLRGNPELNKVISQVLKDSPDLYAECVHVAESVWLERESALREAELKKTQDAISKRISSEEEAVRASQNLQKLCESITSHQEELNVIVKEIEKSTAEKKQLSDEIESQLKGFEKDIVQTMKSAGIYKFLGESGERTNANRSNIRSCRAFQTECEIEIYETDSESVEDLYEDLADNLSIWFDTPSDIAALLLACFTNKLGILVPASIGLNVAMAYSMLMDGSMPLQIEMTQDKNTVFEAADIINSSNIRTVYIEGIIDSFREPEVGMLMRLCPGKNLFFSVGDSQALSLMSKALFDKVMWLDAEQVMKVVPDDESGLNASPQAGTIVIDVDKKEIKQLYNRYLLKLYNEQVIRKSQAVLMANVMQAYYAIYQDKRLGSCMKEAIKIMCIDDPDTSEMIEEILRLQKE